MYCNKCGAPQLHDGPVNCPRCAQPLDATAAMERPSFDTTSGGDSKPMWAPDDHPRLVVVSGRSQGSSYLVRGRSLIGRHDACEIVLDDVSVSRRHATLLPSDVGLLVDDLDSVNGTYLNGDRIDAPTEATNGDTLLVGRFRLLVIGPRHREAPSVGLQRRAT
jgi:hypothetical protein